MKVVLVNPPLTTEERYGVHFQSGGQTPPLGLASLASVLIENHIDVRIIDGAISNDYLQTVAEILNEEPDCVGITASTVSIYNAAKIAQMIKERNFFVTTVIGGPHITAVPEETMGRFPEFDIGVVGEAEHTIVELLDTDGDLARTLAHRPVIKGIVFRYDGKIIQTERRSFIEDLDKLPMPAWHLLPKLSEFYCPPVHTVKRLPAALMVTSRGCPAKCLPSDERILMSDGITTKPISEIKIYDIVSSINKSGNMANSCVVAIRQTPARRDIIKITTKVDGVLRCTAGHRILTENGWKEAGTLKVGDWVVKKREQAKNPSETTLGIGKTNAQTAVFNEQPNEKSHYRREKQTISVSQCRCEGTSEAKDADKQPDETAMHQRQSQSEYDNLLQTIKRPCTESTSQGCNHSWSNDQSRKAKDKRQNETKQPYESKRNKEQSNSHFETKDTFQPQELLRTMVPEENRAESHRSRVGTTIGSSRIQICGRWEILDRSLPEREMQKSRLHLEEWQKQSSPTLQFNILAQPIISRRLGNDGGLQNKWLESIHNYGGNAETLAGYNQLGSAVVTFCQVVSIVHDNPTEVFDIETIPHHNFVASGFVVHNCTFCDRSVFGNRMRANSADYVMGMMRKLYHEYGIREFQFRDDNFLAFRARLVKLCTLMREEKLDAVWSLAGRIDMVNPEVLKLLSDAGCWQIWYGIESGSQKILDFINKRTKLDGIREAVKWTKDAGISVGGFFMMGLPSETREDIEATIRFSRELGLDEAHFTFFTPFPGCELYNTIGQYGEFDDDWRKTSCWNPIFVPRGLSSKQLVHYWKRATIGFYMRPRIVLNYIRKIRSLKHIKIYLSGVLALLEAVLFKKYASSESQ